MTRVAFYEHGFGHHLLGGQPVSKSRRWHGEVGEGEEASGGAQAVLWRRSNGMAEGLELGVRGGWEAQLTPGWETGECRGGAVYGDREAQEEGAVEQKGTWLSLC